MIVNTKHPETSVPEVTDWLTYIRTEQIRLEAELKDCKQNLKEETQRLFAPLPAARNKWESIMLTFNRGISVYEGVMTGLTIVRGVRRLFGKK